MGGACPPLECSHRPLFKNLPKNYHLSGDCWEKDTRTEEHSRGIETCGMWVFRFGMRKVRNSQTPCRTTRPDRKQQGGMFHTMHTPVPAFYRYSHITTYI